jgi:membrane-associated phospholipid phosphatase
MRYTQRMYNFVCQMFGVFRLLFPELCVAAACLILGASSSFLTPYDAVFYEQDPSLSRERFEAAVPSWLLGVLCAALPGGVLLALCLLAPRPSPRMPGFAGDVRALPLEGVRALPLVGLALALTSTMLATNAVKNYVGSKRPNFFDVCNYAGYAAAIDSRNTSSPAWRAFSAATVFGAPGSLGRCVGSAAAVADAQRSFPSGHASLSFAGLFYLALSLRHFAGVRPGDWLSPAALACGSPLALATFVAATRVRDNYHREVDVAAGAALGVALALAAWSTVRARHGGLLPRPLCGGSDLCGGGDFCGGSDGGKGEGGGAPGGGQAPAPAAAATTTPPWAVVS